MSSAWLFADYYEGTYLRQQQILQTAILRLHVLLWARTLRRMMRRWYS